MLLQRDLRQGVVVALGPGVFIVGTDTGVGKTLVTAGLLHCLRQSGVDAVPMKPVQTGGLRDGSQLVAPDLSFCLQTAGLTPSSGTIALMNPYCFAAPCSPHLASEAEALTIDTDHMIDCLRALQENHQAVIVEGAGGLIVPLNEGETMLDLVRKTSLPVIIVARRGLGTINHTLLTLGTLRASNVEVLGVIFNDTAPCESNMIASSNIATIARVGRTLALGELEFIHSKSLLQLQENLRRDFAVRVSGWRLLLDMLRTDR